MVIRLLESDYSFVCAYSRCKERYIIAAGSKVDRGGYTHSLGVKSNYGIIHFRTDIRALVFRQRRRCKHCFIYRKFGVNKFRSAVIFGYTSGIVNADIILSCVSRTDRGIRRRFCRTDTCIHGVSEYNIGYVAVCQDKELVKTFHEGPFARLTVCPVKNFGKIRVFDKLKYVRIGGDLKCYCRSVSFVKRIVIEMRSIDLNRCGVCSDRSSGYIGSNRYRIVVGGRSRLAYTAVTEYDCLGNDCQDFVCKAEAACSGTYLEHIGILVCSCSIRYHRVFPVHVNGTLINCIIVLA